MTTTTSVLDLESNSYKQVIRDSFIRILRTKFKPEDKIFGSSLCGATAIFENQVKKEFTNSIGFCAENNIHTMFEAKRNLPSGYEIKHGNWDEIIKDVESPEDCIGSWAWEDYCCNPFNDCGSIKASNENVYGITFCLNGRRKGGKLGIISEFTADEENFVLKEDVVDEDSNTWNIDAKDVKNEWLVKAVLYMNSNWWNVIPHSIFLYNGGKNSQTPMVTFLFLNEKKYQYSDNYFDCEKPLGFDGIHFINLIDVQKGKSTMEEQLKGFNNDMIGMTKEEFKSTVHKFSKAGLTNKEIATTLKVSLNRVAAVMAWKNNPDSWKK